MVNRHGHGFSKENLRRWQAYVSSPNGAEIASPRVIVGGITAEEMRLATSAWNERVLTAAEREFLLTTVPGGIPAIRHATDEQYALLVELNICPADRAAFEEGKILSWGGD